MILPPLLEAILRLASNVRHSLWVHFWHNQQTVPTSRSSRTPSLGAFIVAGHSRAYGVLYPLASGFGSQEMSSGALAKLSRVWLLDASYNYQRQPFRRQHFEDWVRSKPSLSIDFLYREGTSTDQFADPVSGRLRKEFEDWQSMGGLNLTPLSAGLHDHCSVPATFLPGLLAATNAPGLELAASNERASATSLRDRIVLTATEQWERWGQGAKVETDPERRPILLEYWLSCEDSATAKRNAKNAASVPWSSAFVSWVMRTVNAGNAFPYDSYHVNYVLAAKKRRDQGVGDSFWAFNIDEVKPEVGDIIIVGREENKGAKRMSNVVADLPSHGDIVVRFDKSKVEVIGGNVTNVASGTVGVTVNKKQKYTLDPRGFLRAGGSVFAIVKAPPHADENALVPLAVPFPNQLAAIAEDQHARYHLMDEADSVLCKQIQAYWTDLGLTFESCVSVPWSAVFASWCVQRAGATAAEFKFSAAHSEFVYEAIKNANSGTGVFQAFDVSAQGPAIGDLIHNNRAGNSFDFTYATKNKSYFSHSAIVVETGEDTAGRYALTVGGNEGNSIRKTVVRLTAAGLVAQRTVNPFICVVRNLK